MYRRNIEDPSVIVYQQSNENCIQFPDDPLILIENLKNGKRISVQAKWLDYEQESAYFNLRPEYLKSIPSEMMRKLTPEVRKELMGTPFFNLVMVMKIDIKRIIERNFQGASEVYLEEGKIIRPVTQLEIEKIWNYLNASGSLEKILDASKLPTNYLNIVALAVKTFAPLRPEVMLPSFVALHKSLGQRYQQYFENDFYKNLEKFTESYFKGEILLD